MTLVWAARVAALVAVAVACYLTLTPDPTGAGVLPDWAGHLMIFAGVGASFAVLRRASGWPASALVGLGIAVAFVAVGTEVAQAYTPRDPALRDLAFDLVGGLSALLAMDWVAPRLARSRSG
ncbi:MAG: hypothetical protein DWI58_03970 [Chloroflexi bacterium]|nr:MAG: hypothetical protein DWI58_03970 [Chloroflexota bacterium]